MYTYKLFFEVLKKQYHACKKPFSFRYFCSEYLNIVIICVLSIITIPYSFFTVIPQIFFLNKNDSFCQSYISKVLFSFVEHQLRKLAYYLSFFFFFNLITWKDLYKI